MRLLSSHQIQENLEKICKCPNLDTFIYDVMLAYGLPKASITRLKSGNLNVSKREGDILWKGKVLYRTAETDRFLTEVESARYDESIRKFKPRFIIVSDGVSWACLDTKTNDTLAICIEELPKYYDFFNPWAGVEKQQITLENPADVRAAQRMGKIYDEITKQNRDLPSHDLNVFMARLLFCFFAEDSDIFNEEGIFTRYVKENTLEDGSDLSKHLDDMFAVMNTPDDSPKRDPVPVALRKFPYVNGGLFRNVHPVPNISAKARQAIIDAGKLDWSDINTDIFGNMFQACIAKDKRACLGEHYTSVPNIMKVIRPLFLDELTEAAEKAKGNEIAARKFIDRISKIRFFDPACGSANFLLITFKELRNLEMDVLESVPSLLPMPSVSIKQFYGIELDDFAHEIAMLSLWLVDHQMNQAFFERFGKVVPTLPLKPNNNIILGNALRTDWESVCPKKLSTLAPFYTLDPLLNNAAPEAQDAEIYVFGNPPYLGGKKENDSQKEEQANIFEPYDTNYRDLDYVSCWFMRAAEYIKGTKAKVGFVSTNSVTQGLQVVNLWKPLLGLGIEINFAYTSFKWTNNAKYQAGVSCVIVGLNDKSFSNSRYKLYYGDYEVEVSHISPYLISGDDVFVEPLLSKKNNCLPDILIGNAPVDNGNLILTYDEKEWFISNYPDLKYLIKKYMGSDEFIKGKERYCLWIENRDLECVKSNDFITMRLLKVEEFRKVSKKKATQRFAKLSHLFMQRTYKKSNSILIPLVSSNRRDYIPIGYVDENVVISNLAFAVYDAELWVFAVLTSKMHMVWMRTVGSKMGVGYRYSASLCYNTFPLREMSEEEKTRLEELAYEVLDTRAIHPGMTMADLYDPDKMPEDLKRVHEKLDWEVDKLYRKVAFKNDEERLECLFDLYRQMTQK